MHDFKLQSPFWDADPEQGCPPFIGAGLLQRRLRVTMPDPQVVLQAFHAPHAPQRPSTSVVIY